MSQQIHLSDISEAAMNAHNAVHAALASGSVHYDGPEYGPDASGSPPRTPIILVGGVAPPANANEAAAFIIACKDFVNAHLTYADGVLGEKWYAHKVPDTLNTITNVMGPWSAVESALLEAARILVNDCCTLYENHRRNIGGNWHAAIDTANNLGTPITYTFAQWTGQVGVERTNYLKALFNDHIVLTAGGVHSASDGGNTITAANALFDMVTGVDWPSWLTLLTDMRAKMIAHPPTAVHMAPDNTNIVTAPLPSVPSGVFDLVNEILTDWNLHVPSTTFHAIEDSASQTSILVVATIADMITAAQQLYDKVRQHVQSAPLSRSIRRVV